MEAFVTGVAAGYGIAIPVGAIAVLIVQTGIKRDFPMAFIAGLGAATADLVYSALAVLGGTAIGDAVTSAGRWLDYASAAALVAIAVLGLTRSNRPQRNPVDGSSIRAAGVVATYARFLGLTIINPATVVYFGAVVVGLGLAQGLGAGAGVAFVAGAFLASLSWQTLLAGFGAFAGHRLSARSRQIAVIVGNLLILVLAAVILL